MRDEYKFNLISTLGKLASKAKIPELLNKIKEKYNLALERIIGLKNKLFPNNATQKLPKPKAV